jgi:hypothetical protein
MSSILPQVFGEVRRILGGGRFSHWSSSRL